MLSTVLTVVGIGSTLQVDFHDISFGVEDDSKIFIPWTNSLQAQILTMEKN